MGCVVIPCLLLNNTLLDPAATARAEQLNTSSSSSTEGVMLLLCRNPAGRVSMLLLVVQPLLYDQDFGLVEGRWRPFPQELKSTNQIIGEKSKAMKQMWKRQ
jgi:hypothetical protein